MKQTEVDTNLLNFQVIEAIEELARERETRHSNYYLPFNKQLQLSVKSVVAVVFDLVHGHFTSILVFDYLFFYTCLQK